MPEKNSYIAYLSITSYINSKAQLLILHSIVLYVNILIRKGFK
jgi:hypothetical protein